MPTRIQATDVYVLQTKIDNQMAAGERAAVRSLDRIEQAAQRTAEGIREAGSATGEAGGRILQATSSFDRLSGKYDDVTKAANRLQGAQAELQRVQSAYARDVANGTGDSEDSSRSVAALGSRIETLAKNLGLGARRNRGEHRG